MKGKERDKKRITKHHTRELENRETDTERKSLKRKHHV